MLMLKNHVARTRMANNDSRKKIHFHQVNVLLSTVLFSSFRHRSQVSNCHHVDCIRVLVVRSFVSPVTTDESAWTSLKLEKGRKGGIVIGPKHIFQTSPASWRRSNLFYASFYTWERNLPRTYNKARLGR